jgi:hypothetical protein
LGKARALVAATEHWCEQFEKAEAELQAALDGVELDAVPTTEKVGLSRDEPEPVKESRTSLRDFDPRDHDAIAAPPRDDLRVTRLAGGGAEVSRSMKRGKR